MFALSDIRVLEVGMGVAIPMWTRMLATMGCRVLKVEPPDDDWSRRRGPFHADIPDPDSSAFYHAFNYNKDAVTIDASTEKGLTVSC